MKPIALAVGHHLRWRPASRHDSPQVVASLVESAERPTLALERQPGCSSSPCNICERKTRQQCSCCGGACHGVLPCGKKTGDGVMCFICQQDELPGAERRAAEDSLRKQADRMLQASSDIDKSLLPIGTNVRVDISISTKPETSRPT